MRPGYYRHPTIHNDFVVLVSEDDLWSVSAQGGLAQRLTSNLALCTRPSLSPDGEWLAYVGREEGQSEIFMMSAVGGQPIRLTHLSSSLCLTSGWTDQGEILFASNAAQPFETMMHLYTVDIKGNTPKRLNFGPARAIAYGPEGSLAIGRNAGDPARWKRYRGGSAGQLWIDDNGDGEFHPLIRLEGNLASPMWLGERIYFLSDHEGIGNLYSCLPSGEDLIRHTDHGEFYARNASTDGKRIVYHAGADVFLFDPGGGEKGRIPIEYPSPQTQRNRKFVNSGKFLQDWAIHPDGHSVAITSRGKLFTFANWEGGVTQHGEPDGVRYRLPQWLNDGERMVAVTDVGGEEALIIIHIDGTKEPEILEGLDIGRPNGILVNPKKDQLVLSNHRYELMFVDLDKQELRLIDRGKVGHISGYDWAPDGEWVAYSVSASLHVSVLKLWHSESGEITPLATPVLHDRSPSFDPDGKYLYFLSYRDFDPVYDNMQFDLNFPRGVRPFLITLEKEMLSPFISLPRAPGKKISDALQAQTESEGEEEDTVPQEEDEEEGEKKEKGKEEKPIQIDLEGIEQRIVGFPVPEGRYGRVVGLKGGKVLYSRYPVEGALNRTWVPGVPPAKGILLSYDFEEQKEEMLITKITNFDISRDSETLIYRAKNKLRVLKAGIKPEKGAGQKTGRESGWLDLTRVKVSVLPGSEWKQMFTEAWRLQRDQFWRPDISQVNWLDVYNRYLPLVERVSSRGEFSDLLWETQGELGTSHAYELLGDYRPGPVYPQGYLGAEFVFDSEQEGWRIVDIIGGDVWDEETGSPLQRPGTNVNIGDVLIAINGRPLGQDFSPAEALVNLAGSEVVLTLAGNEDAPPRSITVKTLKYERPLRYRAWVVENRRRVHDATAGRVGYVHIPDMGPKGYAEFHRGYLAEVDREALIVDVRFNKGGNVSSLILEKLARRRIGYDVARWGETPRPYPRESVMGPMVALTNEWAGSDGDIFSHGFKMLGLGPLLGVRTWGGVVGVIPQLSLVDGTVTTQPEFSFWFSDVGWGMENYGTDPDIEVENTPQDYARGVDTQLDRAIEEIQKLIEAQPPKLPDFEEPPSRSLPKLPKRKKGEG